MGTLFWLWFSATILVYTGDTSNDTDRTSMENARNSNAKHKPSNVNDTDGISNTFDEASNTNNIGETSSINGTDESSNNIVTVVEAVIGKTSKTTGIDEDSKINDDVSDLKGAAEHVYSNRFIMKTSLSLAEVEHIAARNGFELKKKVIDGFYLLKRKTTMPQMSKKPISLSANMTLKKHPMIESFEQEKYLKRYHRQLKPGGSNGAKSTSSPYAAKRSQYSPVINDDHWRYMWYLHNDTRPSMGIYKAWSRGYTGSGVTIAFLDDGVDTTHKDLTSNYRRALSYNYIFDKYSPDHSYGDSGHGTSCAGIVSAEKNSYCILGIAYNSNFAALKILDHTNYHTASDEAMAFTHYKYKIDIYSNSWGPRDDGILYEEPDTVAKNALITGVLEGRGGKGSIYVFASGNGGQNDDDCNCDGYSNSIYTITINSLSNTKKPAHYAEPCTAVLATTYGGDYPNPMIVTTNRSDTCTKEFQGTSASTPIASGIIALTLEANPDLTWRDIQHIIVETSSNAGLIDFEGFTINDVGKKVSRYHGFGLMNADAMISKALAWKSVPEQFNARTHYIYPYRSTGFSVSSSVLLKTTIKYIEHVTVTIYFSSFFRGNAIFHLTSPRGTQSKILGSRSQDFTLMTEARYFTFSSVQTWGEDPSGTWTLEMGSAGFDTGSFGGKCLYGNQCLQSDHCCDKKLEVCYHKSGASCYQDSADKTTSNPWALIYFNLFSSSSPSTYISSTFSSKRTDNWLDGDDSGATKCHTRSIIILIIVSVILIF